MRSRLILCCLFSGLASWANAQSPADVDKDLSLFQTPMATALKENIKQKDLEKITTPQLREAALSMLEKNTAHNTVLLITRHTSLPQPLGKN
ncbi:hypothetical protein [Paraflavitalea speifideaquila]|uniref:hypothetical protein n=1 Tax=Paraflavitalea speifideaquila TaxID=3076558 RepID=UPI0028EEDED4|nr:hypothetical protein [Paraflavitalea speifideiaquila]